MSSPNANSFVPVYFWLAIKRVTIFGKRLLTLFKTNFKIRFTNLFRSGDLLGGLVPQFGQNSLPIGEAFTAWQTHRHFPVGNLAIVDRMFGRQESILNYTILMIKKC